MWSIEGFVDAGQKRGSWVYIRLVQTTSRGIRVINSTVVEFRMQKSLYSENRHMMTTISVVARQNIYRYTYIYIHTHIRTQKDTHASISS